MHATPRQIEKIMEKPTVSVEDAARVLGLGRGLAYQAVNRGEIRSIKIGNRLLVPTSALRELLEGRIPAA